MISPSANPRTPGRERRPRRSAQQPPKTTHHVGRIRIHPVGRADPGAPRRNTHVFPQIRANSQNAGQCVCGFARMVSCGKILLRGPGHGLTPASTKQSALTLSLPPAGEGAAHKGGRRARTRRDRDVEMTAAGGICERFLPSAGGQVLPLPSSASRGIGGCHLPPLGEGKDGKHAAAL